VHAAEKIGVVGRTGSGKSSLLMTFLRIVECEGFSSSSSSPDFAMTVLGRPMRDYELHDLRRLFAMIPQDPLLFDGTVRSNLDPFEECTDDEIHDALAKVGMQQRLANDGQLNSVVLEQGSNFSVGQRQLLCLARALLRRGSRFVLMDEATANIDPGLDRLIQNTVKTALAKHTVITIAHRLHTVLEYETILVLDKGKVAESGRPWVLAKDKKSILRNMIASHGPEVEKKLMKLVERSRRFHEKRGH
jgi:ABC-type multidrug transport system fused ATPase/permease subunit